MFTKTITDSKEYQAQKAALQYFQGPCIVKLLDFNDSTQTLIMEDLGGYTLKDVFPEEDECATKMAYELITKLHKFSEKQSQFPHLEDWCAYLAKPYNLPQDLLNHAKTLANELLATTKQKVLLHGDLHHSNIMLRAGQAIAIDPKPVWGDPLFEPARFILNPIDCILDHPNLKPLLENRIQQFATFFNDKKSRIAKWTFVCAMIAACWNIEDTFSPDAWIILARLLVEQDFYA